MVGWNGSGKGYSVARLTVALVMAAAIAVAAAAEQAQRPSAPNPPQIDTISAAAAAADGYDGGFRFCRIRFRTSPQGDGAGWYVDYPRADQNLSIRLSQLTSIPVTTVGEGDPVNIVIRLTDAELYQCPFVMMTEPGGAEFDDQEAAQLGIYLQK